MSTKFWEEEGVGGVVVDGGEVGEGVVEGRGVERGFGGCRRHSSSCFLEGMFTSGIQKRQIHVQTEDACLLTGCPSGTAGSKFVTPKTTGRWQALTFLGGKAIATTASA
jgi:hypothetical protein